MSTREFYDQTPIGVCIVLRERLRMDVLYANEALTRMMQPPSTGDDKERITITPDIIIGRPLEAAWPSKEMEKLARGLKSTTPPRDFILPVYDIESFEKRWAKLTIQESTFEGEDVYILWAADISASKEAEGRLRHAVEEADALAEMKSNFLATMSHEIRTPMQSVYGLLELIGEEKPDLHIKVMVDTAKMSASNLLEILDDILDFAKMDSDKMELDTFEVPVRTLVRGIIEALSVKVRGRDVTMVDEIADDVPFVIIGDPKRLRQIIMNLLGNALKFMEEGTVTVRVSAENKVIEQPKKGFVLRVEVIDNGIGMAEETCGRLFQPFNQADNSTARKYGGTGLGLSICKKLVGLMGGQIGVDSVEGEGSTFWFEIPTEEVGTDATTVELPSLDGISILSVEDHPQGAKEIVRSLESMGASVESCPTYKEGLELAGRRPFDVGIIDQGLPDGLGIDLIREIMDIRPFMGQIMYTVRDDSGMQHTLQSLGVAYLAKPASRIGLGEAVQDAARKSVKINTDGSRRLLIAEDTESVRDVLQRQIKKIGVEADFVEDGIEAMKAFETGKYGILFTDLHMPGMDGFAIVKEIRRREAEEEQEMKGETAVVQRLPIIVLTADVQMAQRQTYLSAGFDECLLKPISLGQLRQLLTRWGFLDKNMTDTHDMPEEKKKPVQQDEQKEGLPPAVDIEKVKEQMGSFDAGTIEMLHLFVEITEPQLEKFEKALANDDYGGLHELAHSLKGASRSAGCVVLGDIAAQLQIDAADKKPCEKLVSGIFAEFERAKDMINALKAA